MSSLVLDLSKVVHLLRVQMGQQGEACFSSLAKAFQRSDVDRSGFVTYTEFEDALGYAGLFAKRQELTRIYRYFDPDLRENLDYNQFLTALRGEMSPRRLDVVRLVWEKLACDRKHVPVKLLLGAYSTANHPRVRSGDRSQQEVFREFVVNFENAAGVDGEVTWEQFANYNREISVSTPYNDDYFVQELEQAWGVTENTTRVAMPAALVRKVVDVLHEKIRQRLKQDGSESEQLRLTFKHFDIANSGMLGLRGFTDALMRFGMVLDDEAARALFADFEQEDGRINYSEFVAAIFHGPELQATYKGVTTQPLPPGEVIPVSVLMLLGGPCSATGSFASRLRHEFGLVHLNVEDLVRAQQQNPKSALGRTLSLGATATPHEQAGVVAEAIQEYASMGKLQFVLDGFPRNTRQLEAWDEIAAQLGATVFSAVYLEVPDHVLKKRMMIRDPKGLAITRQLDAFHNGLRPVLDELHKRQVLAAVDADRSEDQVYAQVRSFVQ